MPRIYTSANDPMDFCGKCWKRLYYTEQKAKTVFGDVGEGPDNRGNCFEYEAYHPDYDGLDYKCQECGAELNERDDY